MNDKKRAYSAAELFTTEELTSLDKSAVEKIKQYRKSNADDMQSLSHLESASTKVFENAYSPPKKKLKFKKPSSQPASKLIAASKPKNKPRFDDDEEDEDDDDGDDDDDDEDLKIERFHVDEDSSYFHDPVKANLHKRQRDFDNNARDDWYNQFMDSQSSTKTKKKNKSINRSNDVICDDDDDDDDDDFDNDYDEQIVDVNRLFLKKTENETSNEIEDLEKQSLSNILSMVVTYLGDNRETVSAALRRLAPPKINRNKKLPPQTEEQKELHNENLLKLERLTSLASVCLEKRYYEIYNKTKEQIIQDIQKF